MLRITLLLILTILTLEHSAQTATPPSSMPSALPQRVPISTEISRIAWTNVSEFLPARSGQGNAAELYDKALKQIRQAPQFPSLPADRKKFAAEPTIQSALSLAFEGAMNRQADFLPLYSYRIWEQNGTPDLEAAVVLTRALGRSASLFLEAGDSAKAMAAAQTLLSMGDHFRGSAPTLAQAVAGEAMIHEGLRNARAAFSRLGEKDKARIAGERAAGITGVEASLQARSAAMSGAWQTPAMALRALSDPEPVVRADALLLVEAAFDPTGSQRLMQDPKIQPVITLLSNDKPAVRKAIEPLLQDSNLLVRTLASRAMAAAMK